MGQGPRRGYGPESGDLQVITRALLPEGKGSSARDVTDSNVASERPMVLRRVRSSAEGRLVPEPAGKGLVRAGGRPATLRRWRTPFRLPPSGPICDTPGRGGNGQLRFEGPVGQPP